MSTVKKILLTLALWMFGGLTISMIFGDGSMGTIIQGAILIGGTIYIWTRPKIKIEDEKDYNNNNVQ